MFGGGIGPQELLVILVLVLLLFGGKKLPELARGLGKGIREFRKASSSIEDEVKESMKLEEKTEEKNQKAG
jgi:sec-independent protein translocase protein TatA